MAITALPTPPTRSDPANFNTRADEFLGALPTFATEANALQTDVNAKQVTASSAATTATTQAGIATTQATTATTQAGIATTAANNALAVYDQFDDRWLGAKTSDPLVDNDGNALQTGAGYFNSVTNETRLYNGSFWQVAFGNITGDFNIIRELKTATASQTVFVLTNSYTVGTNSIMIYVNGVRMLNSDYTETNTSTITFTTGLSAGDEVLFEIGVVNTGSATSATLTSFNPTAGISATNVQDALAELDNEKASLTGIETLTNKTITFSGNTLTDVASTNTTQTLTNKTITGLRETKVAVAASAISLTTGNYFTKTISSTTAFTVSNVPASGTTASFILELTNGGAFTVNWWAGVKWAGGTAPTLTAAGVDILGFYTHDGGTTWRGLVLAKDSK